MGEGADAMSYVAVYSPRRCSEEGCSTTAAYVVRTQRNEDVRYFCRYHRRIADKLAEQITQGEEREDK